MPSAIEWTSSARLRQRSGLSSRPITRRFATHHGVDRNLEYHCRACTEGGPNRRENSGLSEAIALVFSCDCDRRRHVYNPPLRSSTNRRWGLPDSCPRTLQLSLRNLYASAHPRDMHEAVVQQDHGVFRQAFDGGESNAVDPSFGLARNDHDADPLCPHPLERKLPTKSDATQSLMLRAFASMAHTLPSRQQREG